MAYLFRREDDGEVVEVDFATHMGQDAAGYITLPDGVKARRVNDFHYERTPSEPQNANRTPPVSDNLGFQARQLAEFEEDRTRNGFRGVEFKPDPMCPEFFQVHFSTYEERDRYLKHRGKVDQNKTSGAALTKEALDAAVAYAKNIGK